MNLLCLVGLHDWTNWRRVHLLDKTSFNFSTCRRCRKDRARP